MTKITVDITSIITHKITKSIDSFSKFSKNDLSDYEGRLAVQILTFQIKRQTVIQNGKVETLTVQYQTQKSLKVIH